MTAPADLVRRFEELLVYRSTGKPSPATVKAYRQDFDAIASLLAAAADTTVNELDRTVVDKNHMRAAFATYAETHSAASIRRCWST